MVNAVIAVHAGAVHVEHQVQGADVGADHARVRPAWARGGGGGDGAWRQICHRAPGGASRRSCGGRRAGRAQHGLSPPPPPERVGELLPQVEPTLAEWAAFFAAGAGKRAAAQAGLPSAATAREADDLLRDADTFLSLTEHALGVAGQALLPLRPRRSCSIAPARPGSLDVPAQRPAPYPCSVPFDWAVACSVPFDCPLGMSLEEPA